jgi:cytochrome c oxidase assembly factor CtaG
VIAAAPAATSFSFEPLFAVLAAAALYGYVRLARTVERPSAWRAALFGLGLVLVAVPLNSPLETIAIHYLLVVHLLQNVMIADWAPPLLVLGLTPRAGAAGSRSRPVRASRCRSGSRSGTACTCRSSTTTPCGIRGC